MSLEYINSFVGEYVDDLSKTLTLSISMDQSYPIIGYAPSVISRCSLVPISEKDFDDALRSFTKQEKHELREIYRALEKQHMGQVTLGVTLDLLREVLLDFSPNTGRDLEIIPLAEHLGFNLPEAAYCPEYEIVCEEDFLIIMATTKQQVKHKREKTTKANREECKEEVESKQEGNLVKADKEAECKEEEKCNNGGETSNPRDLSIVKDDKEKIKEMDSKKAGEASSRRDLSLEKEEEPKLKEVESTNGSEKNTLLSDESEIDLEEVKRLFNRFDKFRKGYITKRDLRKIAVALGEDITESEIAEMVKSVAPSGRVTLEDFLAFIEV